MSTKSSFPKMLNQKAVATTPLKAATPKPIHAQKSPGEGEFAWLGANLFKHPLVNRGKDIAVSPWAHMPKKGIKNG